VYFFVFCGDYVYFFVFCGDYVYFFVFLLHFIDLVVGYRSLGRWMRYSELCESSSRARAFG